MENEKKNYYLIFYFIVFKLSWVILNNCKKYCFNKKDHIKNNIYNSWHIIHNISKIFIFYFFYIYRLKINNLFLSHEEIINKQIKNK